MPKLGEGYARGLIVPPGKRDVQVFDDALPGFGIRKFASGRASYFVKYAVGTQQRKISLGPVLPGNFAAKRKMADEILARARLGQDTVADKRSSAGKKRSTLGPLIATYLDEREPKLRPRYYSEIKRQLQKDWKPLHSQSVESISKLDVVSTIDDIANTQGATAGDRARVALSSFYAWAIERGYCDANPTMNISPRSDATPRDRVLSESELVEVWQACEDDDYGKIVRLLILLGQRRREIGDLSWDELDLARRQLELPAHRVKNNRPHLVPLSNEALGILLSVKRLPDRELVFGRGAGGFSGWSKAKAELDARIAARRKAAATKKPMAPWVLHDLRRSFVTHLNENKIAPPHIIEVVVNHVSGHLAGVSGVYNRAAYISERRRALDQWSAHFAGLLVIQSGGGARAWDPSSPQPATRTVVAGKP